jgi:hypothetical protein
VSPISREPGAALFLALSAVLTTAIGIFLRQPLLLLILNAVPPYLIFIDRVRATRYSAALWLMVVWAFCQSVSVIVLTQALPDAAAAAIFRGASYRDEMFRWIQTGTGAEGEWRLFLPQHAAHYSVFLILSALTAGAAGLVFGTILLNYMSFYVASLFLADSGGEHTRQLVLMGFPIWAILRVIGFIAGAVAAADLSLVLLDQLRDKPRSWPGRTSYFLSLSVALVILDALLKGLLAPQWRLSLMSALVHTPVGPGH